MGDTRWREALDLAVEAALAAGELLRQELHRPGGPRGDRHKAPADREAEDLIRAGLTEAFPTWGFRAEERPAENRTGAAGAPVWLVDPNDGTSPFHECERGSAVSIGLIHGGRPVLGVVYAYAAPDDRGDLFAWAEGGALTRNGAQVSGPLPTRLDASHTVLVSHHADRCSAANAATVAPARFRAVPSIAYRLALVAAGEAAAATSFGGPQDYDVAGGHALLLGAGGELVTASGIPVTYDDRHTHGLGSCCGGSVEVARALALRGAPPTHPQDPREPYGLAGPVRGDLVADVGVLSRAQGCLLGLVAGDALGGLVEFKTAATIAALWSEGPRDLIDGGHWNTLGGQPTDDSEMALCLARALVASGLDEEAIARAYAWWYRSPPYDMGGTTATALEPAARALDRGAAVADAARRAASRTSQANGALMRVAPLGVFLHAATPDDAMDAARADAALTHPHRVCQDANAVFAATLACAVREGRDPASLYRFATDLASSLHPDVQQTVAAAAVGPPAEYYHQMGWVRIALHNAFWQLLSAPSLEEGVVDTVRRGGDTDTNAAIAGALLGAVHGRDAVPGRWRDRILSCRPIRGLAGVSQPRPKPLWPVDLMMLAERLLTSGRRDAEGRAQRWVSA
ncbi:MAG: hypothetical protein AMXMBFR64_52250 [Myxococcales bacterium]